MQLIKQNVLETQIVHQTLPSQQPVFSRKCVNLLAFL